ncbi:AraC family transcriptional regulator N-terminal domain-containing protein [Paenibacillus thailandensis]|uniref:AraC family transcriptional regulator N-terminal domain-containing protein n=1 Tax=Paenibacillus thailandensis TaxID=393250 RepID=A0ABW5QVK4_9BACL
MSLRIIPPEIASQQEELARLIQRHAAADGTHGTAVGALHFLRSSRVMEPIHRVSKPSICVVAQGAKTSALGEERYVYDPSAYLVTSVQLPIIGRIVEASPEAPFLGLEITFNTDDILKVAQKTDSIGDGETGPGIMVNPTTPELLDPIIRLVKLLDKPEDIPFLAPLIVREILYRVLQGEPGALMKQFAVSGSYANGVAKAIHHIKRDYDKPISIEELAKEVNLSPSALHKHFKKVTNLSPLQYQKMIRLQEARRLLLTEALNAADAGFRGGYESPTQFSREYARMFGRPPISDVKQMRDSINGFEM